MLQSVYIVISKEHHVTKLMISHCHDKVKHQGIKWDDPLLEVLRPRQESWQHEFVNLDKKDLYGAKRWRCVKFLAEQYWCRWKRKYLQNTITRQCRHSAGINLKQVGDVLDIDELLPRSEWRLARVLETVIAKDGLVRRVKISLGDKRLNNTCQRSTRRSTLECP